MDEPSGIPHPLPDALVELIAQRFRVIGEPMRIRLLDRLRDGAATVQELTEATGASQQNVSKHLGVLLQAGIVSREKQRQLRALRDRRRVRVRALRAGLRRAAPPAARARRDPAGNGAMSVRPHLLQRSGAGRLNACFSRSPARSRWAARCSPPSSRPGSCCDRVRRHQPVALRGRRCLSGLADHRARLRAALGDLPRDESGARG